MDFRSLLFVGLGSFVGGVLRFVSVFWIDRKEVGDFPLGVLLVNAFGSFAIGLALPLYERMGWGRDDAAPLLISVGLLGGFTTFSTFSLQTLRLLQSGHLGLAGLNALGSVVACLLSVYLGWKLGEFFWS